MSLGVSILNHRNCCGRLQGLVRTYTATDDCGNTATTTQTITVVDTTPPNITCPADATVECGDNTEPIATGKASGGDDCGLVTINHVDFQ